MAYVAEIRPDKKIRDMLETKQNTAEKKILRRIAGKIIRSTNIRR